MSTGAVRRWWWWVTHPAEVNAWYRELERCMHDALDAAQPVLEAEELAGMTEPPAP